VKLSVDPVSQVRLARLHGVAAMGDSELFASTQWRSCVEAVENQFSV
jgi:hypothetical protein